MDNFHAPQEDYATYNEINEEFDYRVTICYMMVVAAANCFIPSMPVSLKKEIHLLTLVRVLEI